MQQTQNLGLNKPEYPDVVDIEDLNENMDIIDGKLGTTGHNHNGTAGNGPKISGANIVAPRTDQTQDIGTAKELRWQNYGNNHTIVDASAGAYPGGNANAQSAWTPSCPTLIGYNGVNTYGVRVDSARVADTASAVQWSGISGIPSTFAPNNHTHDDRYYTETEISNLLAAKAPLTSPAFTNTPTAPTAAAGTNSTQIATTAFVKTAVSGAASIVASGTGENYYWRKWSNGDMEIWGTITGTLGSMGTHTSGVTITFPVQFQTACKNVIISQPDWKGENAYIWRVLKNSKSIAGFSVAEDRWDNKGAGNPASADYYAFGN
ncbi:gp53-like domain-containing protein [Sporomusa acidovorans]|uniref:Tail fiber protein n=1 Tax=Sporomusa acidovorans (strain ATCC 49682 / DSM 3132 / Mol) TaxID=1123286 RepID=A0ABZ3J7T1_SPOA4|nr:hypothetical protein [Sporomusa acidovorans]OZC23826.1 hypothetical protein SPACI_04510 [Sporomusa acidovorans DSM 3132]SDF62330.1 hypothetical protein SAMN04488499_106331 [Sporomusa acidovorans]